MSHPMTEAERLSRAGHAIAARRDCDGNAIDPNYFADATAAIRAYLGDDVVVPGWQSIETAPRDGASILATDSRVEDWHEAVWWDDELRSWRTNDGTVSYADSFYTHWMPLPAPPSPDRAQKTGG